MRVERHYAALCALGPLLACFGGVDGRSDAPAAWGDPNFWVKLQDIQVSEGSLQPFFDPEGTNFEVTVENYEVEDLVVMLALDTSKYDLLMCPKIMMNGKEMNYNPTEGLTVQIPLNETIGPLDKHVTFTLIDPHPSTGLFAPKAAEHEYVLRIRQPPVYAEVVKLMGLVAEAGGETLSSEPAFDGESDTVNYLFRIWRWTSTVRMKFTCGKWATGMTFNAVWKPLSPDHSIVVTVDTPMATQSIIVQCLYSDPEWTEGGTVASTYGITINKRVDLSNTRVELEAINAQGHCDRRDTHDVSAGFTCRAYEEFVTLICYYNNSRARMFLSDSDEVQNVFNGLPLIINVPKGERYNYRLKLTAAERKRIFPVEVHWVTSCFEFDCPPGWNRRKDEAAKCSGTYCTFADHSNCCIEGPKGGEMVCSAVQCPSGYEPVKNAGQVVCQSKTVMDGCTVQTCCSRRASCVESACSWGLGVRQDAENILCAGQFCAESDEPTCCVVEATCEGFECPVGFVLHDNPEVFFCAGDECGPQDTFQCCAAVGHCGDYTCPAGKVRKKYAEHIQCETARCLSHEEDKCCVQAQTCEGFRCPPCKIPREGAAGMFCASERCSAHDSTRCCLGRGWTLGGEGQTCDAVCNDSGGCIEEEEAWPSSEEDFRSIAVDLGERCTMLQTGEAAYDPSITGDNHCGWKAFRPDPAFEALYASFAVRCPAEPPPQTRRFCACAGDESCRAKPLNQTGTLIRL